MARGKKLISMAGTFCKNLIVLFFIAQQIPIIQAHFKDSVCDLNRRIPNFHKSKHLRIPDGHIVRIVRNPLSLEKKAGKNPIQLRKLIQFPGQRVK